MFWLFCLQRNNEEKLKNAQTLEMHRKQQIVNYFGLNTENTQSLVHRALSGIIYFIGILSCSINVSLLQLPMMASQQEYVIILY